MLSFLNLSNLIDKNLYIPFLSDSLIISKVEWYFLKHLLAIFLSPLVDCWLISCCCWSVAKLCPTLCDLMDCPTLCDLVDCSTLGSSVCGALYTGIFAISFSRDTSQTRGRTHVSCKKKKKASFLLSCGSSLYIIDSFLALWSLINTCGRDEGSATALSLECK